ncbi:MAG: DUF6088 family protein [Acidobacteriota bacterium]
MQSIENKILSKIYGNGRGLAFSQKDFMSIGSRQSIDIALHRLQKKGIIRRVMWGIYDYPKYSEKLKIELSPDIDQVAHAIARKSGWRINPSGPAALNLLGLSTQVPAHYLYLSDGPDRSYRVGNYTLVFKHTALKEANFKLAESSIIVQALRSLGKNHITPDVIKTLRAWPDQKLRSRILKDTTAVADWIYQVIRKIYQEGNELKGMETNGKE